jgi:hypothetical protein
MAVRKLDEHNPIADCVRIANAFARLAIFGDIFLVQVLQNLASDFAAFPA